MHLCFIVPLSIAHVAVTLWLSVSTPSLVAALGRGDVGAGLALLAGLGAVLFGIRLTCAVILSGLAQIAQLFGPAAARSCARAAVAMSPRRFRHVFAASCAGFVVAGSALSTAAAAQPAAPSPDWLSRTPEVTSSAPTSPGWPSRTAAPPTEADPTPPGTSPSASPSGSQSASPDAPPSAPPSSSPGWPTRPSPSAPSPTASSPSAPSSSASRTGEQNRGTDADSAHSESHRTPENSAHPPRPQQRERTPSAPRTLTVSAGDSLWSIAEDHYETADEQQLQKHVNDLYTTNRHIIGADPNLIMPGQRLEMP